MASEGYELLALFMRYVFVGLGALILWRAFRWMRRDARQYKRQMKRLPDAGLIGEVVDLNTGARCPLPREGVMGSASFCDVRVKGRSVARRHALFSLVEGRGVLVTPCRHRRVAMENVELTGPAYALHGTELWLGEVPLRVRLFAGLNVPHPVAYAQDERMMDDVDGDLSGLEEFLTPGPERGGAFAPAPPPYETQGFEAPVCEAPYETQGFEAPGYETPGYETPGIPQEPLLPENEEAAPYASPLPRHRRRGRL